MCVDEIVTFCVRNPSFAHRAEVKGRKLLAGMKFSITGTPNSYVDRQKCILVICGGSILLKLIFYIHAIRHELFTEESGQVD